MDLEWLRFQVAEGYREKFVQQDNAIWTAALSPYPGFLGKEVWIDPDNDTEIVTIVRWNSFEEWQAVPQEVLSKTETAFSEAMGDTYELLESRHYQTRKFGESSR
jgi:uncharacterized protein (TIGR03792 family)